MTLENKYTEAMGALRVTPEMRRRVLEGAVREAGRTGEQHSPGRPAAFRRCMPAALAACLCLAVLSAALLPQLTRREPNPVQIVNPVEKTESLEELAGQTPFPLRTPGRLPEGYAVESAGLIAGTLVQVYYQGPGGRISYRMAAGNGDVSGDYNTYGEESAVRAGDYDVTLRGDGTGVSLAVWTGDGFSYSLSFETPVEEKTALAIIGGIN